MTLAACLSRFSAFASPAGLAMTSPGIASDAPLASVAELLRRRARERGAQTAFTFTDEAGSAMATLRDLTVGLAGSCALLGRGRQGWLLKC